MYADVPEGFVVLERDQPLKPYQLYSVSIADDGYNATGSFMIVKDSGRYQLLNIKRYLEEPEKFIECAKRYNTIAEIRNDCLLDR